MSGLQKLGITDERRAEDHPFDNIPFLVGETKLHDCQFGPNKPVQGKCLWLQISSAHVQVKAFTLYPISQGEREGQFKVAVESIVAHVQNALM